MEAWRSSYIVEVWKVVLSWLVASSTIKDSYVVEVYRSFERDPLGAN